MAYFSAQKDDFASDSGLWNFFDTNGSHAYTGGGLQVVHSVAAWGESGISRKVKKNFLANVGFFFKFRVDVLDNASDFGSTFQIGWNQTQTISGAGTTVSAYFYNTPAGTAPKVHGQASGVANDINPAGNVAVNDIIYVNIIVDGSTPPQMYGQVLGGPYATPTAFWSINGVDATAYDVYPQIDIYGPDTLTILGYGYYDSNGPTPDAPTTPTSSATGETSIDVGWTNVESAVFETGFKVERSLTSGSGFSVVDTIAFGTTTYSDSGLDPGTTYYYRIRSYFTFFGVDYYSAYTSETSATTDSPPVTSTPGEDALMVDILD